MKRKQGWGLGLALIMVAGVRLWGLSEAPLFNDEAIYLDWGYRMTTGLVGRYYSVFDGKPPLMLWLFGWAQQIITNPLIAGRLVSVGMGFLGLMGVWVVGRLRGSFYQATWLMLIYGLQPLIVFYDRQALLEPGVMAALAWFLVALEYKKVNPAKAGITGGLALAIGMWIKPTMLIYAGSMLLVDWLLSRNLRREFTFGVILAATWIWGIAPLWLKPGLISGLMIRAVDYTGGGSWTGNLWLLGCLGLISMGPLVGLGRQINKRLGLRIALASVIITGLMRTGEIRYLVPLIAWFPFIVLWQRGTTGWEKKLVALTLVYYGLFNFLLIIKPLVWMQGFRAIGIESIERAYAGDFSAGYAANEAVVWLKTNLNNHEGVVYVFNTSGNPEDSIRVLLRGQPGIRVKTTSGCEPESGGNKALTGKLGEKIYFVSRKDNLLGCGKYLDERKRFKQPASMDWVGVHEVRF